MKLCNIIKMTFLQFFFFWGGINLFIPPLSTPLVISNAGVVCKTHALQVGKPAADDESDDSSPCQRCHFVAGHLCTEGLHQSVSFSLSSLRFVQ